MGRAAWPNDLISNNFVGLRSSSLRATDLLGYYWGRRAWVSICAHTGAQSNRSFGLHAPERANLVSVCDDAPFCPLLRPPVYET
jgi:hypothetical protein